jgi:hypothetical protein
MTTALNFKAYFDLPMWRPEAPALGVSAAGTSFAWDHRNTNNGSPYQYYLRALTAFEAHDPISGEWMSLQSPTLSGTGATVAAGATALFNPSQGPRGILAAGNTNTKIVLSTALAAAVAANQLANRGDGTGFRIRVIGNGAGSSGKIEERTIVANSAGQTPTITLDASLSFTPVAGDGYEIRSGKVFLLASGTQAAGTTFKAYDIATNSFSTNLTATSSCATNSLAAIATDTNGLALSEAHVPYNRVSGEGFVPTIITPISSSDGKKCILATASSVNTITGSDMFTDLQANEYINFQIRIVEDITTPTSVNQRRRITGHTAGAAGVFTLVSNWTVAPSASAKFVVENDDDRMLFRSSATTFVYTYNITANTWDTTSFAAAGTAHGAGVVFEQGFGYERDVQANARHSHIYCIRGGSPAIDVLDIASGATGTWSADIIYGKKGQTFTTGTSGAYDPVTMQGRLLHININGTQRMAKFDMKNRVMDAGSYLRFPQGTATVGQKLCNGVFIDGATKSNLLYQMTHTQAQMLSLVIQ